MSYVLPIDRGTVDILKAIATRIRMKGLNCVHPRKEMEVSEHLTYQRMVQEGLMTSNQVGNLSRPRFHGLIAAVRDNPGNYCMTRKGADFLRGAVVPRYAIVSKVTGHQIGYLEQETYTCTIGDFSEFPDYWEPLGYRIEEGRIVFDGGFSCPAAS